ncbi:hypothetical protein TPMD03_79 [Thiohalocapsa phage LS06-2018-MD03]|nr:hypothetical protein TPMD03_79 [Thiohalocapsa phage LS06-2018-MD03]
MTAHQHTTTWKHINILQHDSTSTYYNMEAHQHTTT